MMKRFIAVLLAALTLLAVSACGAEKTPANEPEKEQAAEPASGDGLKYKNKVNFHVSTKKTGEFFIRDPFVLVYDNVYFMYGTASTPLPSGRGYGCYVSEDGENWVGPVSVFDSPYESDMAGDFWAPECYEYNGKFYLFATYKSVSTGYRGTSIFRADNPLGPFEEISDGHVTPHNQDSIDGTLYVDGDGQPWCVYVDEWTANADGLGRMAAAKLSDDLSSFVSEPVDLFGAKDAPWATGGITDGPFLYEMSGTDTLLMLWSNSNRDGYSVGVARSESGSVTGPWVQEKEVLFGRANSAEGFDGGHGMLFTAPDGTLTMAIHSPNGHSDNWSYFEHAQFLPVAEDKQNDTLTLVSAVN